MGIREYLDKKFGKKEWKMKSKDGEYISPDEKAEEDSILAKEAAEAEKFRKELAAKRAEAKEVQSWLDSRKKQKLAEEQKATSGTVQPSTRKSKDSKTPSTITSKPKSTSPIDEEKMAKKRRETNIDIPIIDNSTDSGFTIDD